jgi:hypothetical protein
MVSAKCPRWLVPNCSSNPCAVTCRRGTAITPALLTSRSRPSSRPASRPASRATESRSARSSATGSTTAPGTWRTIASRASRPRPASRQASSTTARPGSRCPNWRRSPARYGPAGPACRRQPNQLARRFSHHPADTDHPGTTAARCCITGQLDSPRPGRGARAPVRGPRIPRAQGRARPLARARRPQRLARPVDHRPLPEFNEWNPLPDREGREFHSWNWRWCGWGKRDG